MEICGHKPRNSSSHQKLEKKGNEFTLEIPERVWLCQYVDFGPGILISHYGPKNDDILNLYCFKPPRFWYIATVVPGD